ncbi:MAG TPA: hypothetical protein VGL81_31540 [Polyangiaceae bacterium]|jgi:hypothetical protein
MAMSDEWTEWHLTPRGWERGSDQVDGGGGRRRDPPSDRVLTSRFHEYWGGVSSEVSRTNEVEWRGGDASLIETLLKQFGPAPERL